MLIGYARALTAGESLSLQIEALNGADVGQLFIDVASGAKAKHPQRERAEALLRKREGGILVVWSLDRLDRNIRDLVKMIEEFGRRGVGFRSLKECVTYE